MVTLQLNRGSTNKTVAEKSDCGLFHFVFFFFFRNLTKTPIYLEVTKIGWSWREGAGS